MSLFTNALLFLLLLPITYFFALLLASALPRRKRTGSVTPRNRFAVVIAAHDEEAVIERTVSQLKALDYPSEFFDVHVVADWCTDGTAAIAERAGAIVRHRDCLPRGGKGSALSWLFAQILRGDIYDAVVVFDADTRVDARFLRVMDEYLEEGHAVIQGQHRISNPRVGWFPALTEAKFLIDNQVHNLGRTALKLSAKNMGDSVCLRRDVLQKVGWGAGLTEDHELRQKLLLRGISIAYAPEAIGYGEAPPTWNEARTQRLRWMKGAKEVNKSFRRKLLWEGLKLKSPATIDAALEATFPTFSTVAAMAVVFTTISLTPPWFKFTGLIVAYPFFALLIAKAPPRAFLALLGGPLFLAWRAAAALRLRLFPSEIAWVRTPHGRPA